MKHAVLIKTGVLDYERAWEWQRGLHRDRVQGLIPDTLVLTEHPHTYTLGKTAHEDNLIADESQLKKTGIEVFRIDRGGDITYHGPGQIVGYPILDLHDHYLDVHRFLRDLEEVMIRTLSEYGITAGRVDGMTGVWVGDAKLAAIGVKVSRWVTMHGFAFNVNTDLSYFGNIVPCGISDKTVISMQQVLARPVDSQEVRDIIASKFAEIFDCRFTEEGSGFRGSRFRVKKIKTQLSEEL